MEKLFHGRTDLLPLWIAEPYIDLAPEVVAALAARSGVGWYGYETRPGRLIDAFWEWAGTRHGWDGSDLKAAQSPSVGTSIGVLLELMTQTGDGVIIQPPVFTDFKPLIARADRTAVTNPLVLTHGGYRMDIDDLAVKAADPANKVLILCNPHNPVGRVWLHDELASVAAVCTSNDVFVIADEIHADLALTPNRFVPFARAAQASGVMWAAIHGPIKTFGVAGVCDTLLVSDIDSVMDRFQSASSRLHLNRNNVFAIAAFEAAYRTGANWLDRLLDVVAENAALLRDNLPHGIDIVAPEGTYLAWLDFRALGMDVPELAAWLPLKARLALSPGHWFGRQGAGFARMTIAVPKETIEDAIERLHGAVATS